MAADAEQTSDRVVGVVVQPVSNVAERRAGYAPKIAVVFVVVDFAVVVVVEVVHFRHSTNALIKISIFRASIAEIFRSLVRPRFSTNTRRTCI